MDAGEDLATAVLHCKAMAAVQMVEKLYAHLTKRSIAPTETIIEDTPAYARPTASNLHLHVFYLQQKKKMVSQIGKVVKDKLKDPVAVEEKDQLTNTGYVQEAIDQHQMQLRQDRMNDRERYTHTSKHRMMTQRMLRVATRQVQHDDFKQPQIQFLKTVNVKPITDSMAQIKGTQRFSNGQSTPSATPSRSTAAESERNQKVKSEVSQSKKKSTVSSVLDSVLAEALPPADSKAAKMSDFVDEIAKKSCNEVKLVFQALVNSGLDECVALSMEHPKQFWKLSGMCCKALAGTSEEGLDAVARFYFAFADSCGKVDAGDAAELFQDYLRPKLVILIKTLPARREILAEMLGAFCFRESHLLTLLRVLKEDLDTPLLLECFGILSSHIEFKSKEIQDAYLFYVSLGLRSSSKHARSHALRILANLCKDQSNLCLSLLDELQKALEDPWWGIRAGVVHVAFAAISSMDEGNKDLVTLMELMNGTLKAAPPMVQRASIYWMSHCLPGNKRARTLFLEQWKAAPKDMKAQFCSPGSSDGDIAGFASFPRRKAFNVAELVIKDLTDSKEQNLSPKHIELLSASIFILTVLRKSDEEIWIRVLKSLGRYILVELADEDRCEWARNVLEKFFSEDGTRHSTLSFLLKPQGAQEAPLFFGVLKMMYPGRPAKCQHTLEQFLADIVKRYPETYRDVYNLLKNFETTEKERFDASNFKELMASMKM